ncbi:hypothetical protein AAHA92_01717 [Salvia divinorum]|uniref:KIB1-4 beta-propeller domain-containing protein n=1 Tax=Salvia divinorum TaxID=28513 RepID=A0ABD1IBG4_SALDI
MASSPSSSSSTFLMLPIADEDTQEIQHLSFYNLKNNKPYNLKIQPNLENTQLRCIGSSKGWLAFLDQTLENPFLFNPITQTLIHLPRNHPGITKLILSQDPSLRPQTSAAVAIQTLLFTSKLSFCRSGGSAWHDLPSQSETYYDAVCCDATNTLFALSLELELSDEAFPDDLYSWQWYLALSPAGAGEVIAAVRYVGEFVRYDGEVVYEGDTLTDYMAAPLVCPYRTMGFRVFRADVRGGGGGGEWADVEGFGDHAMLLGGNETAVVPAVDLMKNNAIYFTDDYWERIDEDYSYGGHDFGVFCMGDLRFEEVFDFEMEKINPPPFWITLPSST